MKVEKKEKQNKFTLLTQKGGVSLIVLIITIVVILILASAIIISLANGGLIGYANEAVEKTEEVEEKEQIQLALASWKIENSMTGIDIIEHLSSNEIFDKVTYFDETEIEIIVSMSETKKNYLVNTTNGEIGIYNGTPIILDNDVIVVGVDDINQIKAKYNHEEGTIEWQNSNEDVIKITTNKNVVQIEVIGYGNAIITAKVGEHTANCDIMVPEIDNNGTITHISAGTKNQLLEINKLNKAGKLGTNWGSVGTIDITTDIDMENIEWRPLYAPGLLINGNGNKISNLNCIQETENGRSGFIGYGGGSTISNLTLENVTAVGTQVGAFVGYAIDGAVLTGCKLIGDNVISWQQNTGEYKEDYSGIGALIGMPFDSSSRASSATIEGNVTIKYNNMPTYCFEADETGALGFKVSSTTSFDFHNIDTTKAIIIKEGTWTKK